MSTWSWVILVTTAWLLWVVAAAFELEAAKRRGERPADAGVSVLPVIPLFPLALLCVAWVLNRFVSPWGTRIVGALHVLMIAACLMGIVIYARRIRSRERL